jgi:plastocyanin
VAWNFCLSPFANSKTSNMTILLSPNVIALNLLALVATAGVDVRVGVDGLQFTSETVTAQPGGQVNFHFHGSIHTSTEATGNLANPCRRV